MLVQNCNFKELSNRGTTMVLINQALIRKR